MMIDNDASEPAWHVLDADGRVAADVHCLTCAYNLRSLAVDGACPECGNPVASSMRCDLLHLSPPAWVQRVADGLTLLLATAACFVIAAVMLAATKLATGPFADRIPVSFIALLIGERLITLALFAMLAGAVVGVTNRHPTAVPERPEVSYRRFLRGCLWVGLAPLLGGLATALAMLRCAGLWAPVSFFALKCLTLLVCVFAIPFALLRYLGILFDRGRKHSLARFAHLVSLGPLVIGFIFAFESAVTLFYEAWGEGRRSVPAIVQDLLFYAHPLSVCGGVVFAIGGFAFVVLARRVFSRAARQAREYSTATSKVESTDRT